MTQLSINTTQNVNINFTTASVGERILATITDIVVLASYGFMITWLLFQVFGLNKVMQGLDQWSAGAIMIIIFFPVMFYTLIMESVFEGQTLGKMLLKIKVVKIDGYQASFGDYLIRWLFRLVEVWTFFGVIGLISIITNKKALPHYRKGF